MHISVGKNLEMVSNSEATARCIDADLVLRPSQALPMSFSVELTRVVDFLTASR